MSTDVADSTPVPRLGGVVVAAAFLAVSVLIWVAYPAYWRSDIHAGPAILWTGIAIFLTGFWNDFRPLKLPLKLLIQSVLSLAVYLHGIRIDSFNPPVIHIDCPLGPWSSVVTVVWLVTLTNVFSRIDAVNCLSGGLGLVLMGLLAFLGAGVGSGFQALCAIGMAGALLGFLVYNLPPTRIALGGGGAGFLGFLIGNLSIMHHGQDGSSAGLLVVALPLLGAALVGWCFSSGSRPLLPSLSGAARRPMAPAAMTRPRSRS